MYFIKKGFSELSTHCNEKSNVLHLLLLLYCKAYKFCFLFFNLGSRISSSFNHQTMTTRTKLLVISFDIEII